MARDESSFGRWPRSVSRRYAGCGRDVVCVTCGGHLLRLTATRQDTPESPAVRAAQARRFQAAWELQRQRCSGVVLITIDVEMGLLPSRPFTDGDLERLCGLGRYGWS
jgi:hypothetical protein